MSGMKFRLVPDEPTDAMINAWIESPLSFNKAYDDMLAASPGNDLLERIVSELNAAHALALNHGYKQSADRIDALLNEIGGGHG